MTKEENCACVGVCDRLKITRTRDTRQGKETQEGSKYP